MTNPPVGLNFRLLRFLQSPPAPLASYAPAIRSEISCGLHHSDETPSNHHENSNPCPSGRPTAFCSNCGWVRINRKGNGHWRCKVVERLYRGKKGRRRNLSAFKSGTCDRCGFVPEHPQQLDVHHTDGNRLNNNPANLRTLCANCHRLEHIYIAETQRNL